MADRQGTYRQGIYRQGTGRLAGFIVPPFTANGGSPRDALTQAEATAIHHYNAVLVDQKSSNFTIISWLEISGIASQFASQKSHKKMSARQN